MLFRIKEIGDDGLSLDLPVTAAWLAAECPDLDVVPAAAGLTVRGGLTVSEDQVFLRGKVRGAIETTCSRCLEKAQLSIDIPLAITFMPRSEDGDDEEDDDDNLDVVLFDGDEVDLGPEIRDQLLLALPISRLCREDCAGLCPVCGGNRNQRACDCRAEQPASRTPLAAALGKLKI